MNLEEWTKHYIKFKDAMKRQITNIESVAEGLLVTEKKDTITYLLTDHISSVIQKIPKSTCAIVCYNTKENVHETIKFWDVLHKHNKLKIIFVHIDKNEKWILQPFSHHAVTEPDALEQGLLTMYENVGEYNGY